MFDIIVTREGEKVINFNKKLVISVPVFVATMVAVMMTLIMTNNNQTNVDLNLDMTESDSDSIDSAEVNSTKESDLKDLSDDNNEAETKMEEGKMNQLFVTIGDEKREVTLEDNSTVVEFLKRIPMEFTMKDLNNNEKFIYLDEALPINVYNPGVIEVGDVMLYGNDCLVIFYESFETDYNYTKIGFIDGLPEMGDGDVVVRFSAE